MNLLCVGFGLFFAGLLLHVVVWRIHFPVRQTLAILAVFAGTLVAGLALLLTVPRLEALWPWSPWQILQLTLFHVASSFTYIIFYTGVDGSSPSMTILLEVQSSGGEGRTKEQLSYLVRQDRPIESRVEAMVRDGTLIEKDGIYHLSRKGMLWANMFYGWRTIVAVPRGG